jgi:hypothetical protein
MGGDLIDDRMKRRTEGSLATSPIISGHGLSAGPLKGMLKTAIHDIPAVPTTPGGRT